MNDFEREEEEQEEEDRIDDVVSSDSDNSDDDQGGRHAMTVPVHGMPLPVPTEVLHAMSAQGRLVIDLLADDNPYDSWESDENITASLVQNDGRLVPPCSTPEG